MGNQAAEFRDVTVHHKTLLGDSCSRSVGSGGEGEPVSEYAGGGVSEQR